jgi:hypothetical protein
VKYPNKILEFLVLKVPLDTFWKHLKKVKAEHLLSATLGARF